MTTNPPKAHPDAQFILSAAALSSAAPHEWAAFLASFDALVSRRCEDVVRSPADTIFINQGRAQALQHLADTLRTCRAAAEKITRGR